MTLLLRGCLTPKGSYIYYNLFINLFNISHVGGTHYEVLKYHSFGLEVRIKLIIGRQILINPIAEMIHV